MNKIDSILKKAALYEVLATHGDRRSFLRAIAQEASLSNNIKERINSVLKDLAATKPDSSVNLQNRLMGFMMGSKSDPAELAQLVEEAANTIPGDHTTQVANAHELLNMVRQLGNKPEAAPTESVMMMPEDKITAYAPISKSVQEHLSSLVATRGWGIPLKIDGKLGKETRQAINNFKREMKMSPNATDQEVFALVEKEYAKDNPTDFSWMPEAARQSDEYYKSQSIPPGMEAKK